MKDIPWQYAHDEKELPGSQQRIHELARERAAAKRKADANEKLAREFFMKYLAAKRQGNKSQETINHQAYELHMCRAIELRADWGLGSDQQ